MCKKIIDVFIKTEDEELIPFYATEQAAGVDLKANIEEPIELMPGKSFLVPTGIFLEIPAGFEGLIRPRSGLALKHQITVLNTPGTVDADYRGEIKVILINHGKDIFIIQPKMRIAQMIFAPVYQANFVKKEEFSSTIRGFSGFGHTGIK